MTFNGNEGVFADGESTIEIRQAYDTVFDAPKVNRQGYAFNGWSPQVPTRIPSDNVTFTAQWSQQCVVIFKDGDRIIQAKTLPYGQPVGILPTVFDYTEKQTFVGWYSSVEGGTEITENTIIWNNETYHARWKVEYISITWNSMNG